MTFDLKKAMDEAYEFGKKAERLRIQIMVIKKQTSFINAGMVNGSCGLAWLINELGEKQ
jgi:hypothetical protein